MMTKEQQVCTLEQAMKLKALGIEQKSEYYYINGHVHSIHSLFESLVPVINYVVENVQDPESDVCSAFNVAELGHLIICSNTMLPNRSMSSGEPKFFCMKTGKTFHNEAEARATTLLWLIDKKEFNPFDFVPGTL